MRQLHVRLTDEVGKLLQAYADARGISLNAAAAVIIHDEVMDGPREWTDAELAAARAKAIEHPGYIVTVTRDGRVVDMTP